MKLYTPFSTRLSGSARETELRLRSIFQWKKKRPPMVLIVLVLAIALSCGGLVACREESSASAASPGFGDIGKTLSELKDEHPEGELVVCLDAFPESAAICFGEPEAEYSWCFFGTQSGDAEKAMNELKDRLNCAGLVTTVSVLFPEMEDKMSFEEFFSFIGVENYEYFGEEAIAAEGWLRFSYQGMEVMVNTNEPAAGGGGNVTGAEIVKCDAPVSIVDPEIFLANAELAASIMFQEEISTLPYSAPYSSCLKVIQGDQQFYNVYTGAYMDFNHLRETVTLDNLPFSIQQFAMVDLTGNGVKEVVLQFSLAENNQAGFIVLHDQDGTIYSYPIVNRAMSDLKADGTFTFSSGASDWGIGSLILSSDDYEIKKISYCEDSLFFVNKHPAKQIDFENAVQQQMNKENARWYSFTNDNLSLIPQQ